MFMNKKRYSLIIVSSIFSYFYSFNIVLAKNLEKTNSNNRVLEFVIIDGIKYEKQLLHKIFIRSAIAVPHYGDRYEDLFVKSFKFKKEEYPWAFFHIHPEKGFSKPLSINKWVRPIRISFGMPYDLKPFVSEVVDGKPATEYASYPRVNGKWYGLRNYFPMLNRKMSEFKLFEISENEVRDVVFALSDILPIPISYVPMKDEKKENYSNIRINLFSIDDYTNGEVEVLNIFKRKFKHINSLVNLNAADVYKTNISYFESRFKDVYIFTKTALNQVDGYFLVNEKNEIDFAVCHIWEGHDKLIIKGLIRECILRSLGFPHAFGLNVKKRKAHLSMLYIWNHKNLIDQYSDYLAGSFYITDLDKTLINILYKQELKPGSDYLLLNKFFLK